MYMGGNTKDSQEIKVDNITLTITNVTKILWPRNEIKKMDYLEYLNMVSPYILPFLKNRLLTVIRFPHGVKDKSFYQKNCPSYAPEFVKTHLSNDINYIICNDLATLLWLGNQAAL